MNRITYLIKHVKDNLKRKRGGRKRVRVCNMEAHFKYLFIKNIMTSVSFNPIKKVTSFTVLHYHH